MTENNLEVTEYEHLRTWCERQFPDNANHKIDAILAFLVPMNREDLTYWMSKPWWDVLDIAERQ